MSVPRILKETSVRDALVLSIYLSVVFLFTEKNRVSAECDIVTKIEWNGLAPTRVKYLPRPVNLVIIHHRKGFKCETDEACSRVIRIIQKGHMDLDYWDIGYSFLIGGNAKVYEGRGWLHAGDHTHGYDDRSISLFFIGNYNKTDLQPRVIEAAKSFLRCGMERGHLTYDYHVVAASQVMISNSPGPKIYEAIKIWPEWLEDTSSL